MPKTKKQFNPRVSNKSPAKLLGRLNKDPYLSSAIVSTLSRQLDPKGFSARKKRAGSAAARGMKALEKKYESFLSEAVGNAQNSDGKFSAPEFKDLFKYLHDAFMLGRKASGASKHNELSHQDKKFLRKAAKKEYKFFKKFINDVYKGTSRMPVSMRKNMYVSTLRYLYDLGRVSGGDSNVLIYWILGEAEHCDNCLQLSKDSPFTIDTLPTVPRAGDSCLGFSNCKCRLVVKHSDPITVSNVRARHVPPEDYLRIKFGGSAVRK